MKKAKSILITGGGGYIGSKTIEALLQQKSRPQQIISMDVRAVPMEQQQNNVIYVEEDIRSGRIFDIIKKYKIDTVIHLASIVTPGKNSNREFEYSVDVKGTRNILEACVAHNVEQLILTSSGAAYGYHSDNPEWIKEDDPLRGNQEFAYSDHKRIVEEILAEYRKKYPKLKQLIFRPGTILGKGVKNQITNLFEQKILINVSGADSRFVIIWDMDVAQCIVDGLLQRKTGIYNLAGSGTLNMKQIGKILKKPVLTLPSGLIKGALSILKKFHLTQYGPEQVKFLQYRPVLANTKLINEFGYTPQKTTEEVFRYYLEHRNSA